MARVRGRVHAGRPALVAAHVPAPAHVQDRYVIDHVATEFTDPRRRLGSGERHRPSRRFGAQRGRVMQDALRKALNRTAGGLSEF